MIANMLMNGLQPIWVISATLSRPSAIDFGWLGSRVVSCWTRAQKARVQIVAATLSDNSLRQTVHTHCASVHQAAKLVATLLRVAGVTAGLVESNGSLPPHVTCMLTAKNRDQLRDPTLGNRVWATFTFLVL